MSWFSTNYEKAALGGAVVAALGFAYFGWSKFGAIDKDFSREIKGPSPKQNETAVADADLIPKALQSMGIPRTWVKEVSPDGRAVDLFTGIPLFVSSNDPDTPVDLDKDPPIHEPIPNQWWFENRLDPGFGDSPARDPDSDGFSNLEEFLGKTDPNDAKSHPLLLAKLKFVKEESLIWVLRPGYGSDGKFPFTYWEVQGGAWRDKNKIPAGEMIAPDEVFFTKEPMAGRFKFLGSEVREEFNKRINIEEKITIVRIEDQRPNKVGDIYEIPAPLSEQRKNEFAQHDRTAVFTLEAIGQEGTEFKVEERTAFALPDNAPKKDYFLKSVSPNAVVVEFSDAQGARKSVEIPMGGMPNMTNPAP
jgi:hypothetical protein